MNTQTDVTTAPAPEPEDPNAVPLAEAAPADESAPKSLVGGAEGAPEALALADLKVPEGMTLEGEAGEAFLTQLNEMKIPAEAANSLLALHAEKVAAAQAAQLQSWNDLQESWLKESRELPEIGGDQLNTTLSVVAKALDKYGSKEAREAMDFTGAGNNPHILKFVHSMAKQLVEKPPVSASAPPSTQLSLAQRMFKDN